MIKYKKAPLVLAQMDYEIVPENTAIPNVRPNNIMSNRIFPFLREQKGKKLLDYGAGYTCRDSIYAAGLGFEVDVLDLPKTIKRMDKEDVLRRGIKSIASNLQPNLRYDSILLNFVLNVVPYKAERENILHQINHCLTPEGYAVVTVRSDKIIGRAFNDGLLMGKRKQRTFQKIFLEEELLEQLEAHSLEPVREYKSRNGLFIVAKKIKEDVLYGQMLTSPKNISKDADYLQLSINGKNASMVLSQLEKTHGIPVFLHGDYGNSGRDNAIFDDNRMDEIAGLVLKAKKTCPIYGLTMHSPRKSFARAKGKDFSDMIRRIEELQKETNIPVTLEHRSSDDFSVSSLEEITALGKAPITIDIPALYISAGYNASRLKKSLEGLNSFNVIELHLGDSNPPRQRIGAVIGEGKIPYDKLQMPPSRYRTIEVLSAKSFEKSREELERYDNIL